MDHQCQVISGISPERNPESNNQKFQQVCLSDSDYILKGIYYFLLVPQNLNRTLNYR